MGVFLRRFPQVRTDFPALIDEWAARFFEELDYIKEGNNGIRFAEFMAKELPQVCQQLLTATLSCSQSACLCLAGQPPTLQLQDPSS